MKGKIKFYNEIKGFGFVTGEDGKDYFVHSTSLEGSTSLAKDGNNASLLSLIKIYPSFSSPH